MEMGGSSFLRGFRPFFRPPPSAPSATAAPSSPALSATTQATQASQLDLGDSDVRLIITRADLRASVAAYHELLKAAKEYRESMERSSNASTAFAIALEQCARVKGATESANSLLLGSGLCFMIGNSHQVLSATLLRSFELPLLAAYEEYVTVLSERHDKYEVLLSERTAAIRQTEHENMKQGRKKSRDLNQFRKALESLQEQVRGVEAVKKAYYNETLEKENEMWGLISSKVALLLRSTLELSDRLASKANEPAVEELMRENPDPFDSYREENSETRDLFSVLPPLSMAMSHHGPTTNGSTIREFAAENQSERREESTSASVFASPTMSTPRAQKTMSVSEALGILEKVEGRNVTPRNGGLATIEDVDSPSPRSHSPSPSPGIIRDRLSLSPTMATTSTAEELVPTPLSVENLSLNSSQSDRSLRRVLSPTREVEEEEEEADPMSGDWESNREYGKSLSPVGHGGYNSDE